MWPLIALYAAQGVMKAASDSNQKRADDQLTASTQRYSPWTGLQAKGIQADKTNGDVVGGLATGLAQGQAYQSAQNSDARNTAFMNYLAKNGGPSGAGAIAQAPGQAGGTPSFDFDQLFDPNQQSSRMPRY